MSADGQVSASGFPDEQRYAMRKLSKPWDNRQMDVVEQMMPA